jgi:putative tryptophan/tyrosine transport system substrate-binding protein
MIGGPVPGDADVHPWNERRAFIAGLGGAAAWPLVARAQHIPVIGYLYPTSPEANAERLRAFRLGLKDTGYIEGENVTIA